ncbi:MAG: serine/threonine-protein kinase [Nannocystaceae bacterium]|nr:serine/threonine protein kinase [Myxococcales bacterium]
MDEAPENPTRLLPGAGSDELDAWGSSTRIERRDRDEHRALIGRVFADRYRIIEPISRGGMGAIFRAEHVTIGRPLALKVLRPKFSKDSDVMLRFLQEARVTSQIRQENVVDIIDFGHTPDGLAYLAMELLEGEDLRATLHRDGPLPWPRLAPMVLQICAALEAAHGMGVIHRDMKPANCFRIHHAGNPDFIKVLDFGVAKLLYGIDSERPITTAGQVIGTPLYLPPEVAMGASPTPQFDIYALGVTMYQLLTGERPYKGKVSLNMLRDSALSDPTLPREVNPDVEIAPEVEAIVVKAMHRDPKQRYRSARELAAAVLATSPKSARSGSRLWSSTIVGAGEVSAQRPAGEVADLLAPGPDPEPPRDPLESAGTPRLAAITDSSGSGVIASTDPPARGRFGPRPSEMTTIVEGATEDTTPSMAGGSGPGEAETSASVVMTANPASETSAAQTVFGATESTLGKSLPIVVRRERQALVRQRVALVGALLLLASALLLLLRFLA